MEPLSGNINLFPKDSNVTIQFGDLITLILCQCSRVEQWVLLSLVMVKRIEIFKTKLFQAFYIVLRVNASSNWMECHCPRSLFGFESNIIPLVLSKFSDEIFDIHCPKVRFSWYYWIKLFNFLSRIWWSIWDGPCCYMVG